MGSIDSLPSLRGWGKWQRPFSECPPSISLLERRQLYERRSVVERHTCMTWLNGVAMQPFAMGGREPQSQCFSRGMWQLCFLACLISSGGNTPHLSAFVSFRKGEVETLADMFLLRVKHTCHSLLVLPLVYERGIYRGTNLIERLTSLDME